MTTDARVTWVEDKRFLGQASSGHGVVLDSSAEKLGSSPMELVLIGMAGCTAYDVLSILQKKRQVVTGLEVNARAERAKEPPCVYTAIEVNRKHYRKFASIGIHVKIQNPRHSNCIGISSP